MDPTAPVWELYERHAELWRRNRLPGLTLERDWIERFCSQLPLGAPILDVGCGHGQPIAAQLLRDGFGLWGIDRAPSLINTARTTLPGGHFEVFDMTSFDLGRTFAGIVMWHSLFHLTAVEQRRVFPLLGAHAEPGAVLLFTTGPTAGSASGEFGGEVLAHHSLGHDEYVDLLAVEGFTVVDYRESDPDCGNATVWMAERANAGVGRSGVDV